MNLRLLLCAALLLLGVLAALPSVGGLPGAPLAQRLSPPVLAPLDGPAGVWHGEQKPWRARGRRHQVVEASTAYATHAPTAVAVLELAAPSAQDALEQALAGLWQDVDRVLAARR